MAKNRTVRITYGLLVKGKRLIVRYTRIGKGTPTISWLDPNTGLRKSITSDLLINNLCGLPQGADKRFWVKLVTMDAKALMHALCYSVPSREGAKRYSVNHKDILTVERHKETEWRSRGRELERALDDYLNFILREEENINK